MELFLQRLEIENFKGVKALCLDFGDETHFYGCNASGKSTVVDAFCWLLFNRDSRGNAPGSDKFREKPLDADGHEVHYVDTRVTAKFLLDGQPFELQRVQRENWVKKRGNAEASYQGNASQYWINGVETKSSDFAARINSIANGDVFLLLTSLGAFNALDWKKRRALLVSMCNIDVDAELLNRPEFAEIAQEARERNVSIDDLRSVLASRKKDIAKELTTIPARIDEAKRMRPEHTEHDLHEAEYNLKDAGEDMQRCEALIAECRAGGDDGTLQRQILALEADIVAAKRRISDDYDAQYARLKMAAMDAKRQMEVAGKLCKSTEFCVSDATAKVADAEKALEKLRSDYKAAFGVQFASPDVPTVCPTCGQEMPAEKIDEMIAKAKATFEAEKQDKLAEINKRGQELKRQYTAYAQALTDAQEAHAQAVKQCADAKAAAEAAEQELEAFPATVEFEGDSQLAEMAERLNELKNSQSPDRQGENLKQLEHRKNGLQECIDRARAVIAAKEQADQIDKRIAELEAMQTELGQRRADTEVMLYDVERFIAARCELLEESINDRFPTIRWKLFDRQINGALVDCCECMIPSDGALVSYAGTNTAASVNADIEIIGVLSKYYGVTAPVFVDNAERINYIAKPAGQLITLSVSGDKALRVEIKNAKEAA